MSQALRAWRKAAATRGADGPVNSDGIKTPMHLVADEGARVGIPAPALSKPGADISRRAYFAESTTLLFGARTALVLVVHGPAALADCSGVNAGLVVTDRLKPRSRLFTERSGGVMAKTGGWFVETTVNVATVLVTLPHGLEITI